MKLEVNKSLVDNMDYLQKLAEICKNTKKSDYDENLLYELAYAHEYINSLILIEERPSKELLDIRTLFNGILDFIDIKNLKKVKLDYKDLLKAKFKDIDTGSYMKDIQVCDSPIKAYVKRVFGKYVVLMGLLLLLFSLPVIHDNVSSEASKAEVVESESVAEVVNDSNENFEVDKEVVLHGLNDLTKFLSSFVAILCTAIIVFSSIRIMISLAYISLPVARDILDNYNNGSFVSSDVRDIVRHELEGVGTVVTKVRNFDRIERNKVWLKSMIENPCGLLQLDNAIMVLNDRLKNRDLYKKSYYYDVAQIELLHVKYLEAVGAKAL